MTLLKLHYTGVEAIVEGHLSHPNDGLLFLSLAGSHEAVRALLAALLNHKQTTLLRWSDSHNDWAFDQILSLSYCGEDYHRLIVRKLPSGQVHGLLYPPSAAPQGSGETFTLLLPSGRASEAQARFFRLLDARTTLPLSPSWSADLWKTFDRNSWITALAGEGSWIGWEVRWEDDVLERYIYNAVAAKELPLTHEGSDAHAARVS